MNIEYIMHIAQDCRVLYNNAVNLAICEGCHFTHTYLTARKVNSYVFVC